MNDLVKNLKNPLTGKTLDEEGRIKKTKITDHEFVMEYDATHLNEEAIKEQVKKYYPHLSESQIHLIGKKSYEGPKFIIGVASAKGGVGKSTIALNLALSFKELDLKVGLLDADIYGPSLGLLLGQKKADIYATGANKIVPFDYHGLKFMTFSAFLKGDDPVIWRGPILNGVMKQFLYDVDWQGLDLLVIDLPPGTGDVYLSLVQFVTLTGVVLISTPQDISLLDTMRGFHLFKKFNVPILGLISNMSYFFCDCGKSHYLFGKDIEKKLQGKINLLTELPIEPLMHEANDTGVPYIESYPENLWTKNLKQVAEKIKREVLLTKEQQQKDPQ